MEIESGQERHHCQHTAADFCFLQHSCLLDRDQEVHIMNDPQEKIQTSLQILPHLDFGDTISTLQKCTIPLEVMPELKFHPKPIIAKCIESSTNKQFICKLRSLYNRYPASYCYLEESVSLYSNQVSCNQPLSSTVDRRKISCIEVLNFEETSPKQISVIVTLNENSLKKLYTVPQIKYILKNILELYTLTVDAHIKLDASNDALYGFSDIHITKSTSSPSSAFKINSETHVEIENFKYKTIEWMKCIDLEDLNDISLQLNKLIDDMKLRNEISWQIKPSLMTLIIGLSGSGKTSVCHNFFLQNSCNVFEIISANIIGQYPGETEEHLRRIFQNVICFTSRFKPKDPVVIFIENIELICSSNKINSNSSSAENASVSHSSRIGSQFVTLVDIVQQRNLPILIIGTTSNIEIVDSALRRPGRFENEISIPLLSEKGRKNILGKFLKNLPIDADEDDVETLSFDLAQKSVGFAGADMKLLMHNFNRKMIQLEHCKEDSAWKFEDVKTVFEEVLRMIKPSSLRGADITCITCDERLDSIGGMAQLKRTLEISVLSALERPEIFKKFGLNLPKGILLYGPPGCAKTTIAKCLATESKMRFISTSGAEVYSPYVGKAERFLSKIFDTARKNSPCIIFLDEIDTLVGNRSVGSSNDVQTRILSTLLTEIDGIGLRISNCSIDNENIKILIIAATNRPDLIDNALIRPGRFDKLIHVPAPDEESRLEIFEIYKKRMPFDVNVNCKYLSSITDYYSGADICNLCNEAAIHALTVHPDNERISTDDFIVVLEKFRPSLTRKQIEWYYDFEKQYVG